MQTNWLKFMFVTAILIAAGHLVLLLSPDIGPLIILGVAAGAIAFMASED